MALSEEELRTYQEEIADDKRAASGGRALQDTPSLLSETSERATVVNRRRPETYKEIGQRGLAQARAALAAAKDRQL
jgi:hypothetical protein